MDEQTPYDVSARLDRLERENNLLKIIGGFLVFGSLVALAGPSGWLRSTKRLAAERFELKDRSGQVRGTLGIMDGTPQLALYDLHGRPQVTIEGGDDQSASLSLYNRNEVRVSLSTSPDGSAVFHLLGRRGSGISGLFLRPDGSTGLSLQEGRRGVLLGVRPKGSAELSFTNTEGEDIGSFRITPDGRPQFAGRAMEDHRVLRTASSEEVGGSRTATGSDDDTCPSPKGQATDDAECRQETQTNRSRSAGSGSRSYLPP